MKEHHGLAKQFIRIIALAALESVLLLTVSQVVLATRGCASGSAARRYSSTPPRNTCRSCKAM